MSQAENKKSTQRKGTSENDEELHALHCSGLKKTVTLGSSIHWTLKAWYKRTQLEEEFSGVLDNKNLPAGCVHRVELIPEQPPTVVSSYWHTWR